MTFHWNHETKEWVARVVGRVAESTRVDSVAGVNFIIASSPFETLKRFGKRSEPRRESRGTHLELVELAHGRHGHAGVLRRAGRLERFGPETVRVGGRRGQRPAEGFRSAMAGVAFRDFSRGDHSSRSRVVRSTRRSGRHVPVEGGGEALLQELHLGTPLFHSLRGLRGLGLRILCGWNARDETGGASVSFPRARASESGAGGGVDRRASRVTRG